MAFAVRKSVDEHFTDDKFLFCIERVTVSEEFVAEQQDGMYALTVPNTILKNVKFIFLCSSTKIKRTHSKYNNMLLLRKSDIIRSHVFKLKIPDFHFQTVTLYMNSYLHSMCQ